MHRGAVESEQYAHTYVPSHSHFPSLHSQKRSVPLTTEPLCEDYKGHVRCSRPCNVTVSLLGPLCEPVDSATVDEGRKHATSCTEGIPHRTHAHDNMKLVLHSAYEVSKDAISVGIEGGRAGSVKYTIYGQRVQLPPWRSRQRVSLII